MLSARADDLRDKQNQVKKGLKNATGALEESSSAFTAATKRLTAAQGKLALAQKALAKTQGELTAARVLDTQMQAKLVAAQAALAQAEADLAAGIEDVANKRDEISLVVAENFQKGDPRLLGLSAILHARDINDMGTQLHAVGNLMDQQADMLYELKAKQNQLTVQKGKVAAAKAIVAEQRQAAAVNLARKKALEEKAETNRAQVASFVAQRQAAASQARAARAVDLRKLQQLKKEDARIKRLILARAKQQSGNGFSGNSGGFLLPPVANSYITSPYGYRVHPIYGYYSLHDGDDFHAPCGVPERAAASGTVIEEYYSDVWGNRLFLDVGKVNGKNMTLIYNHISSYKARTGDKVKRGETIAYAGTTGWSTGCHLHFTVMINGNPVNPQNYM
ncbi:M23 family metallopeptidase [Nocardioides marmoriginsengisoli]|uniref:M23 family metallopeptidase n=2 Tax=Nocardioides marmoriginsengisoli TaxID=661483 RepID=A0A3N0CI42_9ACTN|nr:M23 family metallopeptidase [Nocardioides marmoriginsengisoli]